MPLAKGFGVRLGNTVDGQGLARRLGRDLLHEVAAAVAMKQRSRLVQAFSVGGHQNHGGQKWASLAPDTIRAKTRAGKSRIMVRTGRLRGSIRGTHKVGPNAEGVTITMHSDAPYAPFHQHGIRGRLPRRPVLVFTASDVADIKMELRRFAHIALNGRRGLTA